MNVLTKEEERDLASMVVDLCPELQGIGRTADQYVTDSRAVQALTQRVIRLRSALDSIRANSEPNAISLSPELRIQAFNQIAKDALNWRPVDE